MEALHVYAALVEEAIDKYCGQSASTSQRRAPETCAALAKLRADLHRAWDFYERNRGIVESLRHRREMAQASVQRFRSEARRDRSDLVQVKHELEALDREVRDLYARWQSSEPLAEASEKVFGLLREAMNRRRAKQAELFRVAEEIHQQNIDYANGVRKSLHLIGDDAVLAAARVINTLPRGLSTMRFRLFRARAHVVRYLASLRHPKQRITLYVSLLLASFDALSAAVAASLDAVLFLASTGIESAEDLDALLAQAPQIEALANLLDRQHSALEVLIPD